MYFVALIFAAINLVGPVTSSVSAATKFERIESVLKYTIQEEVPRGSVIANLLLDAGLQLKYKHEVLEVLEFRIVSSPPLPFVVDSRLGIVRTDGVIDRDSLMMCKDKLVCAVTLDISVRPAEYFQIIKVGLSVLKNIDYLLL